MSGDYYAYDEDRSRSRSRSRVRPRSSREHNSSYSPNTPVAWPRLSYMSSTRDRSASRASAPGTASTRTPYSADRPVTPVTPVAYTASQKSAMRRVPEPLPLSGIDFRTQSGPSYTSSPRDRSFSRNSTPRRSPSLSRTPFGGSPTSYVPPSTPSPRESLPSADRPPSRAGRTMSRSSSSSTLVDPASASHPDRPSSRARRTVSRFSRTPSPHVGPVGGTYSNRPTPTSSPIRPRLGRD